jgi:phosphoribosylaminoimidazole-succinocarboxamide synthase
MDVMKETAVELRSQAAENKRMMVELTTSVSENRKNIVNLEIRTNLLQEELEALRSKISEVNELRQLVKVSPSSPAFSLTVASSGPERNDR